VLVHAPDRDGLFAAIVIGLDRAGLAILQARALDGPDATIFDTFHVLPNDPRHAPAAAQIEAGLQRVLGSDLSRVLPARRSQPRHLRHFRIAPQVEFAEAEAGRTLVSLVCNDRPGLLADVTRVLREHRLRVHDARIATFGERAEDMFRISDEHDRPLHDDHQRQALRDALLAALDGDPR
jgi:[protein-PII] uridylyltransferase